MKWQVIFQDPVLTAALTDRLTHKSHVLNMNGPSFRMGETEEWLKTEANKVLHFSVAKYIEKKKHIVRKMLDYDEELKANYMLYQELLRAMTNRDYNALEIVLQRRSTKLVSSYMKTSLKTLKNHFSCIKNSFITHIIMEDLKGLTTRLKYLIESHMATETSRILRIESCFITS